jgi:hypothetical protein
MRYHDEEPVRCGRLDKHIAHHWKGPKQYDAEHRKWIRPVYWCSGYVVVEGGQRALHR